MNAQLNNPAKSEELSLLSGVNVLIEGATGTGKTYSVGTLVDSGVQTFFLGIESGMESLFGYYTDQGKEIPPNLHWHVLSGTNTGFAQLLDAADTIGRLTQESLHKIQDMDRDKNNQFKKILQVLSDFSDQRTGQSFGPVDKWGPDKALVIDGLTGLGNFAMNMVAGKKPVRSQPDWGIAQSQVENCLRLLCDGCRCHFVLISHIERETDLVMGGVKITVSTLGRALPPKIPPMFSDVILAVRNGTNFNWSTANALADLKTRNLPLSENIPPTFGAIITKWKSRGGRFSSSVKV